MADKIKLSSALLLLIAGIAGFYYFSQYSMLVRVPVLLVAAAVGVVIALRTAPGGQVIGFFQESQIEVRKVVWPTRRETTQTTLVVMAMVVISALFLWFVDMVLVSAVKMLTGQGG